MKIYTKTGDRGETGLIGGSRVSKSSERIAVVGNLDELNAWLGVCLNHPLPELVSVRLSQLQSLLFDIGAEIACPPGGKYVMNSLLTSDIEILEKEIDAMDHQLAPLKNFILPGGSSASSNLHFARSICRRLERDMISLNERETLRLEVLGYVNRLSDWLFCAARFANQNLQIADIPWQKRQLETETQ
jgi:cob(I)alamin adenosyltransferase